MKLFSNPNSRGARVTAMMAQLGIDFEIVNVDFRAGETRTPEFLKMNPLGQVPVLMLDDGRTITESLAICMYLVEKFPAAGLGPTEEERPEYLQWCMFTACSLESPMMMIKAHTMYLPEEQRIPQVAEMGRGMMDKVLNRLEIALDGKDYLISNRYTAADVLVGGTLAWASDLVDGGKFPNVRRYTDMVLTKDPVHA